MRHITPQLNTKMRLRTRLLAAVLAVGCLGGLAVRLFVLMLRDPGGYALRAADQQLRGATLPAARGEIYAADGTLLAASETCWTIRAAPREMADEAVEPAARALSEILELDYAETLAKFSQRTSNDCLLRRRVDKAMADAVRDWCRDNGVQGVQIRQDTKRVYPQGNFMGGILGFTDVDNAGLWGLELRYNDELTGENGRILTAKNAWGYDMPTHYQTLVDAVPGNTLTLTIDAQIQHWLESALSAAVAEHHVAERKILGLCGDCVFAAAERFGKRDAELSELGGEIQVTLEVRAVDDVQDRVGTLGDEVVTGDDFLQRVGGQGVNTGKVHDDHVIVLLELTFLLFHGDAGPVTDELVRTGQRVEQRRLTAVGVAREGNFDLLFHLSYCSFLLSFLNLCRNKLFNFDHFGVRLTQRQLVAAHGDLHRVAQGRDLAHEHLSALGDAHIHDTALDGALAMELDDFDGLADLDFTQCFHSFLSFFGFLRP